MLTTALVDCAVSKPVDQSVLQFVRPHVHEFAAVLSVAARMGGEVLTPVAREALISMGSLVTINDAVGKQVRAELVMYDRKGVEVMLELVSGRLWNEEHLPIINHCTNVVEQVVAAPMNETVEQIISYAEAVVSRLWTIRSTEPILNALMGVLKQSPPMPFVRVLDTWAEILDMMEDVNLQQNPVELKLFSALSTECLNRALWCRNHQHGLSALSEPGEKGGGRDWTWEHIDAVVSAVSDSQGGGSMLFLEEEEEWQLTTRRGLVRKCIYTVITCVLMAFEKNLSPQHAYINVLISIQCLVKEKTKIILGSNSNPSAIAKDMEDLSTILELFCGLSFLFQTQEEVVIDIISALYYLINGNAFLLDRRLGVAVFRAMSAASCVLQDLRSDFVTQSVNETMAVVETAMKSPESDPQVALAAGLLAVSLLRNCHVLLRGHRMPISPEIIMNSPHSAIKCIGIVSVTKSLICDRKMHPRTPEEFLHMMSTSLKGDDDKFIAMYKSMFTEFLQFREIDVQNTQAMTALANYAGMLRAAMVTVSRGTELHIFMGLVGQEALQKCAHVLHFLKDQVQQTTESAQHMVWKVMQMVMDAVIEVVKFHVGYESMDTVTAIATMALNLWPVAGSANMVRGGLKLITGEIQKGRADFAKGAISVARQCISGNDFDAGISALTLLTEIVKNLGPMFWNDSNHGPQLYYSSVDGIMDAIEDREFALSRYGLFALIRLDTTRKLLKKEDVFVVRYGERLTLACLLLLKNTAFADAEEVVEVLWSMDSENGMKRVTDWIRVRCGSWVVDISDDPVDVSDKKLFGNWIKKVIDTWCEKEAQQRERTSL